MKILLVKTSSMGDVVHTLTAIREAKEQRPELSIDWLIEEDFADIAYIAQASGDINQIIPIRFRQWRKRKPFGVFFNPQIQQLKKTLSNNRYNLVLDAQGLLKSVFLARLANTPIVGFDKNSAREPLATFFYQTAYAIDTNQHAIRRQRQLFAKALGYELLPEPPTYQQKVLPRKKSVLLLHSTTWDNKRYPTEKWHELVKQLSELGYRVLLPQHEDIERRVAKQITKQIDNTELLPKQDIKQLLPTLQSVTAVISVDTGLAHLAVYLGVPTIMLFGPTKAELTGGIGTHAINLIGNGEDMASLKRINYPNNNTFSPSMSAISTPSILSSLKKLTAD